MSSADAPVGSVVADVIVYVKDCCVFIYIKCIYLFYLIGVIRQLMYHT